MAKQGLSILLGAALLLGVGVQARVFAPRVAALEAQAQHVERLLGGPLSDLDPGASAVYAWRSLPALAARIPPGARVLLVSGSIWPAQFHYYFQPHPFAFLQPLEPRLLEQASARNPAMAETQRQQFERLQSKGLRLTPQRLAEELARADYLVLFRGATKPAGVRLEPVAQDEVAALYAIRRDGG